VSGNTKPGAWPDGLVIVDKPGGMTSHDVVARVRRLAHTRRVGHAGTLDPMATGVLVIGIEKATRLLGHLTLTEKTYQATIRLGQSTTTDDAEGDPLPARGSDPPPRSPGGTTPPDPPEAPGRAPDERKGSASSARVTRASAVSRESLEEEIAKLTGEILQVPSSVSAIKVNGQRAYKLARAGEAPELAARPVTIYEFRVTAVRRDGDFLDIDATIRCSSGTYIRALARDLGAALGTGGHLTALRRTAVGPYTLAQARPLNELEAENPSQSAERSRLTLASHAILQPVEVKEAATSPAPAATALHLAGPLTRADASIAASAGEPFIEAGAVGEPSIAASAVGEPRAVPPVTPLAEAAAAAFPRVDLTADEARRLAQGARLPLPANLQFQDSPPWSAASNPPGAVAPSDEPIGARAHSATADIAAGGTAPGRPDVPLAAFDPDGTLVALVTAEDGRLRSLAVFVDATAQTRDT
jgi:tRNA pseudouridine55 synthase